MKTTFLFVGFFIFLALGKLGSWERQREDSLTVPKTEVYSLKAFAEHIRQKTGMEIYVDRREEERQVLIAKGTYKINSLPQALSAATGLPLRQIEKVQFLAPRNMFPYEKLYFPVLPKTLLDKIGKELRFLGEKVDLIKEGIPWAAEDFLTGKNIAANKLNPKEKEFIIKEEWSRRGSLALKQPPLQIKKQIRLGTSYLMTFRVFTPSKSEKEPDPTNFMDTFQIYYDYRDRLGLAVPED